MNNMQEKQHTIGVYLKGLMEAVVHSIKAF